MTKPWGLLVVAAGSGHRFGQQKQFLSLGGKPLVLHGILSLMAIGFQETVLVVPSEFSDSERARLQEHVPEIPLRFANGGATRQASVRAGLNAFSSGISLVAIHDGARPFPPLKETHECLCRMNDGPDTLGCVFIATPLVDCLKRGTKEGIVTKTENRDEYFRSETPQVVRRSSGLALYGNPTFANARDDAEVFERAGFQTAAVFHTDLNPKITYPADLSVAEAFYSLRRGIS